MSETHALRRQRESERGQWLFNFQGKGISVKILLDEVTEALLNFFKKLENTAELSASVAVVHAVALYLLVRALLIVWPCPHLI